MDAPPFHAQLIQMGTSLWVSRIVYAAAKLGLADLLAEGPRTAADLAGPTGTHERSLHRFLRTLGGFGIVSETPNGFVLTTMGEALKTGAPGAARSTILTMAGEWSWKTMEHFLYSLETGRPATDKGLGMPLFDYLAQHPDEASLFSESMVGVHGAEPGAVAEVFDFSGFGTIVDVGGATGNMLCHILQRYPQPRGVLYDRPHVVSDAPAFIAERGLTSRITIEMGNFFDSVPEGGDAYILSHIIHDWTEEQCLTILANCKRAMKPGSKLLIVEFVLPEGNEPHFGKLADMVMLSCPGGEERTAKEYDELLTKAGFQLERVVSTATPVSVVEASIR